jgi:hypothetical protein
MSGRDPGGHMTARAGRYLRPRNLQPLMNPVASMTAPRKNPSQKCSAPVIARIYRDNAPHSRRFRSRSDPPDATEGPVGTFSSSEPPERTGSQVMPVYVVGRRPSQAVPAEVLRRSVLGFEPTGLAIRSLIRRFRSASPATLRHPPVYKGGVTVPGHDQNASSSPSSTNRRWGVGSGCGPGSSAPPFNDLSSRRIHSAMTWT